MKISTFRLKKVAAFLQDCSFKMSRKDFDMNSTVREHQIDKNIIRAIRSLGLAESKKKNGTTTWKWLGDDVVTAETAERIVTELIAFRAKSDESKEQDKPSEEGESNEFKPLTLDKLYKQLNQLERRITSMDIKREQESEAIAQELAKLNLSVSSTASKTNQIYEAVKKLAPQSELFTDNG